jgi:prevent-host-death family protein
MPGVFSSWHATAPVTQYSYNSGHIIGGRMKTLPLAEIKNNLSKLVDRVATMQDEITITRNGRPAAVISPHSPHTPPDMNKIKRNEVNIIDYR